MMHQKSPNIAFLLALFPGGGLLYLRKFRGILYMLAIFGTPVMAIIFFNMVGYHYDELTFWLSAIVSFFLYVVSLIDTARTSSLVIPKHSHEGEGMNEQYSTTRKNEDMERFFTLILSFIPGIGHFQLGLVNRGLTILVSFIGLAVMILFVTALSSRGEFLIFLAFLPIIWIYSFFDVNQQLAKKQKGEQLEDRSILDDFEKHREDGKKSRSIATFLSIFPGAGHLYLGLQKRGIQLMAAFLFSIYILDVLRLSIFLFLIPIIWFYSFFDGLQKASRYGSEPLEDVPVISYLINHQRWVGIGLIVVGSYYLLAEILIPSVAPYLKSIVQIDSYLLNRYFQTIVVCALLIGGGIKLLVGKKEKNEGDSQ